MKSKITIRFLHLMMLMSTWARGKHWANGQTLRPKKALSTMWLVVLKIKCSISCSLES